MASVATMMTRRSILRAVGTAPSLRAAAPSLMLAQRRLASTQTVTAKENLTILNDQRQHRPTSPHLAIYQPQITWTLSIANRMTGAALSGLLYGGSILFLFHPYFPAIDSAHLIQLAHDLPGWLKGSFKLLLALPFTFHSFNGVRHLMWDVGKGLTIKGVYTSGYVVLAATAVSSIYLAFFV